MSTPPPATSPPQDVIKSPNKLRQAGPRATSRQMMSECLRKTSVMTTATPDFCDKHLSSLDDTSIREILRDVEMHRLLNRYKERRTASFYNDFAKFATYVSVRVHKELENIDEDDLIVFIDHHTTELKRSPVDFDAKPDLLAITMSAIKQLALKPGFYKKLESAKVASSLNHSELATLPVKLEVVDDDDDNDVSQDFATHVTPKDDDSDNPFYHDKGTRESDLDFKMSAQDIASKACSFLPISWVDPLASLVEEKTGSSGQSSAEAALQCGAYGGIYNMACPDRPGVYLLAVCPKNYEVM
ncbi:hypothetical protein HGRIS_005237 [Hohenbuehelia grisea]|uniref:Uncharacterized protein n=1 Tax=Hohenbuehelia grisea TaxID=104357 RepID=A0ABR3JED9_9AGAR